MQTIYKYAITNLDGTTIDVPFNGQMKFDEQVLHCDVQQGVPCIWVAVDSEEATRPIRVVVYGTGQDMSKAGALKHIGSFMLLDGAFVGHIFAERR